MSTSTLNDVHLTSTSALNKQVQVNKTSIALNTYKFMNQVQLPK